MTLIQAVVFKKALLYIGGLSWRLKGGEWFQMLPIFLRE
ncbi:hypothetical protein HPHPP4D_0971 [Helicobacter pylori Hp P-4d]|uniref:Uncharacterized protein n=1 Tax=Helicobacter pylori Hp P-4 TaxID=992075 RepID=J0EPB4_HELPX|nr:hypothetical protein HPHPP4_1539 [Helicobacter pylori Hp P-4]EJC22051.1 hypothetical protein HPHPP4C_1591 [Helicobacter pylori Hp P-4c]EJC23923.1 hypothetical protein HPHPP4D_0971 [Helicobacter pylori Hp P-4d]